MPNYQPISVFCVNLEPLQCFTLSTGLLYTAVILIAPVLFLVLLCHYNCWRMDRKFGLILLLWYFLIIIVASLYE